MAHINPKFTISVAENSDRIVGSSEEKFLGIRPGSLIKIGDNSILYTITEKESSLFIKNFTLKDVRTIIVDENLGVDIQQGDTISISYKEYELGMVLEIIEAGKAYEIGSELNIIGGQTNIDMATGMGNRTILIVKEIDKNGGITKLAIKDKGKYLTPPQNPIKSLSENGTDAVLNIKYQEIHNRTLVERQIVSINYEEDKTIIMLDYSLPLNLINGKFSIEKSYLLITPNYLNHSQSNVSYQIFTDFSAHTNLPKMVANSMSSHIIFNNAIDKIDSKFRELENEIRILKDKIS